MGTFNNMTHFILQLKISEILFLLVGTGMLISLPWIDAWGLWIWVGVKFVYFIGIFLFTFNK